MLHGRDVMTPRGRIPPYDHLDKRFQDLVPKFLPTGFNHSSIRDSSAGTVYGNNGSEAVEGPTPARDCPRKADV